MKMTRTRLSMPASLLLISLCIALIFADEMVTGKHEQDEFQNLLVLFPPVGEQTLSISQRTVIRRNPSNITLINDQLLPIIRGFHVNSSIFYRFAQTKICTIVYNPSNDSKEFTFNHAVPKEAYVSGFTIEENGNTEKATFGIYRPNAYDAYNKKSFRKEIAKPIIVSINARHSVLFSLPLEVPAHKELTLCLQYEEILKRTAGNYQYPVHVSTNTVDGIDLKVRIHVKDSDPLRNINITGFVSENKQYSSDSGEALSFKDDVGCRSEVSYIDINCISRSEVVITFRPTEEDQKNFITSYTQSKEIERKDNLMGLGESYYINTSLPTVGLNGKFEILYNVDRSEDDIGGVILYNEKHFVHFLEPPPLDRVNIHLIIVIDYRFDHEHQFEDVITPLTNVVKSMDENGDYFNSVVMVTDIVLLCGFGVRDGMVYQQRSRFSRSDWESGDAETDADESIKRSADRLMKKLNEVVDIPATPITRAEGLPGRHFYEFLRNSDPEAYTEMGLRAAVRCALSCNKENNQTQGVQPLPVILFLPRTDNHGHGVAQHDFSKIASMVTSENVQGPRAQLFALKLDRNSPQNIEEGMWNITAANGGWLDKLYESQDNVKEQVYAFFNATKNPLALNISVTYRNGDKKAPVLTQSIFPTIYSGREVIIGGEFPEGVQENEFQAAASGTFKQNGTYFNDTFHITQYRRIEDTIGESEESVIDRIWAHARIKDLLTKSATAYLKNRSSPGAAKDDSSWQQYDTEGRELSLKYNLLTPFTTLIVQPRETHVMKLAPIVPFDIGEQLLYTVFREESIEVFKTARKLLSRINNVTWIDAIDWRPSLNYAPLRGALNETYFTPLFDATKWYDPQNCSTRTTPPKEGKCEPFVNCILPEVESDLEMFRKYQCKIPRRKYLAICCPKRDQASTSNDFPISEEYRNRQHIYNHFLKKYFLERNIPSTKLTKKELQEELYKAGQTTVKVQR